MLDKKGESIKYAIQKGLSVYSFSDFCKDWGFTLEEVKRFLELGARAFDEERRIEVSNNAERFQQIFGIYATELWAMPEEEFLKWLNSSELG